jgi:hypothetical protein
MSDTRTGAPPRDVLGVRFTCWRTGIMVTAWRSDDGRLEVGRNREASTYWARVNGAAATNPETGKPRRFLSLGAAMQAAVTLSRKSAQ